MAKFRPARVTIETDVGTKLSGDVPVRLNGNPDTGCAAIRTSATTHVSDAIHDP
jgi:hypothetical protein